MQTTNDVIVVAHAIQQSVSPVFLLTGVGAILNVISGRLGRVIDRIRALDTSGEEMRMAHRSEMEVLLRRARWVHWAIILCTTCALFICIVIAALFVGSELGRDPSSTISLLFIVAMIALTSGLLCFLREIALATGNIAGNAKLR